MKIQKTLGCLTIVSLLTFVPMKSYTQDKGISVKIEFPEKRAEIVDYIVNLATDIDDDGITDKKGYETLLDKLELKYDKNQKFEDYQKLMTDYTSNLKTTDQLDDFCEKATSMFTEKDIDMYFDKMFEIIEEVLKETLEKLPEIMDKLNEAT